MKKERLMVIAENLIDYLSESIGRNNGEELYNILSNCIGMTDNEIDELAGNFPQYDFDEEE